MTKDQPMAVSITQAQAHQADAILALVHAAYAHDVARIGKPPAPMLDDYPRRIARCQAWVLEHDHAVAGVLILEDAEGDALLLDNLAVHPSKQGLGFGRLLVAFTEQEAARRGHTSVRLYTNRLMLENLALYTRLGFQETARVTEDGYERIYMEKRVAADARVI